jgi:hypothetical protein
MTYRTKFDNKISAVEQAREEVVKAHIAHQRGASCETVVKADRRLADAWADMTEWYDGRVPVNR